jgi:hypothetical protein
MAGPAYYSAIVSIAKNEDWIVPFVYSSPNGGGAGVPINLTGSTLKLEVRMREADHEALISVFSPDNGIVITDAAAGQFTITIARSRLSRVAAGSYFVDFVRLTPTGVQERIWEGEATIVDGTTR